MGGEPDEITLDDEEQTLVRVLAALRNGNNLINSVRSAKMSPRGDYEVNLDGMGGEYAFAKIKNLCPDFGIGPRSGGHDFLDRKGNTVDVKTNPREDGDLLVRASKKDRPSDWYVLMTGEFPRYSYRGYVHGRELFSDSRLVDLGHGDTYLFPQKELTK